MDKDNTEAARRRRRRRRKQEKSESAKSTKTTSAHAKPTAIKHLASKFSKHVSPPKEVDTVNSRGVNSAPNLADPIEVETNETGPLINAIIIEDSDPETNVTIEDVPEFATFSALPSPKASFIPISAENNLETTASTSSAPSLGLVLGLAIPAGIILFLFIAVLAFSYKRHKKQVIAHQRRDRCPVLSVAFSKEDLNAFIVRPDSIHSIKG